MCLAVGTGSWLGLSGDCQPAHLNEASPRGLCFLIIWWPASKSYIYFFYDQALEFTQYYSHSILFIESKPLELPMSKKRGIKFFLLMEGVSKNLWNV